MIQQRLKATDLPCGGRQFESGDPIADEQHRIGTCTEK